MKRLPRAMKTSVRAWVLAVVSLCCACTQAGSGSAGKASAGAALIGAWRSKIQFTSGSFAQIKDLEFSYVFNQGGTMTESSNYDDAPPVPPAYGVWRAAGAHQFEAKYVFYITTPPKNLTEITGGQGWNPSGYGVLTEYIRLSQDGQTYSSTIDYSAYDSQGKPTEGGGQGHCNGKRIAF